MNARDLAPRFGGAPSLLQNKALALDDLVFAMQFAGRDVPRPHDDLLFLRDAMGYLYLPRRLDSAIGKGLFFAQAS